jgi:hypothetical protein
MNINDAMKMVERQERTAANIYANTDTSAVEAALKRKIAAGEALDDLELAVAINKGYIK